MLRQRGRERQRAAGFSDQEAAGPDQAQWRRVSHWLGERGEALQEQTEGVSGTGHWRTDLEWEVGPARSRHQGLRCCEVLRVGAFGCRAEQPLGVPQCSQAGDGAAMESG